MKIIEKLKPHTTLIVLVCFVCFMLLAYLQWELKKFTYGRNIYSFGVWFSEGYLPSSRLKTGSWKPKKDGFIDYLKSQPDYSPNQYYDVLDGHRELRGIEFLSVDRFGCTYYLKFPDATLMCTSEITPEAINAYRRGKVVDDFNGSCSSG